MNFVPATTQNGTAKASGFEVKLPKAVSAAKGTLGFRPEAVTDRITDGGSTLEMKVDVVERLGSDQYLYGQVGGDSVTARVDPRMSVQPGDKVRLGLDTRTLHFFDAESELALL
jgi:multiple sugar transport system ATP-binding protein